MGDIAVGQSSQAVLQRFGPPAYRTVAHGLGTPQWEYADGLTVFFTGSQAAPGQVWQLRAVPPFAGATAQGLRLEETETQFRTQYAGASIRQSTLPPYALSLAVGDATLTVWFDPGGKAVEVLLSEQGLLCPACAAPAATPLPAGAPTPTVSPSIPARLGQPAHLSTLHMFSADQGIAVDLQGRLLRTLDGGRHWTVVTPTGVERVGPLAAVPNAPGQPVWTVATVSWSTNGEGPGTALLTTADAGWSFQERALPRRLAQASAPPPTFIDAQHGWLLVGLGAAAGSEAVAIYQTVDGGQTWAYVATSASPGAATAAAGAIPFSGDKVGLGFRDAMAGWLAGESGDHPWLYRTLDGGRTWQPQQIHAPIGVGGDLQRQPGAIDPPHFFGLQDGVLPAYWGRGVVLVTHDGGASWTGTTPLPASAHPPLWAFLDARHWWASDGATLSVTSDAGVHWRQIAPHGALTGLDELQFVTPDLGWAVLAARPGRPATVLQTTDSGDTWVDLHPEVLGE